MRYLIAIFCPPLAILLCGRLILAIFSIPLWFCGWLPGALLALLVVSATLADRRNQELIQSIDKNAKVQVKAVQQQTRELTKAMKAQQQTSVINVQVAPASAPHPLPPPRTPMLTASNLRGAIVAAKDGLIGAKSGAIFAYQNLPEWAQPIAWGLAAGTPVSLAMTAYFLMKR